MRKDSHYTQEQLQRLIIACRKPECRLKISLARKGIARTLEERQKISEATKKAMATLPQEVKDKIAHAPDGKRWKSVRRDDAWREKLRLAALADKGRSGRFSGSNNPMFGRCRELNPNWRGGYQGDYPDDYWEIKPYILKRDDYTCQLCFCGAAIAHHIDGNTWNSREDNLISLCRSCHGYLQRKDWEKKKRSYLLIRAARKGALAKVREL